MDPRPERQLRLARRLLRDVERVGVGEHRSVEVGRRPSTGRRTCPPGTARPGTRCPRWRSDRCRAPRRSSASTPRRPAAPARAGRRAAPTAPGCSASTATVQPSWLRVVSVPADDHRLDHHHQLLGRQRVAGLLGGDQVGQQVLGRLVRGGVDQLPGVLVELVLGGHDHRQVLVQVAVEDAQHVGGPAAEQLPVLLRRAEQLADDRDRVRLADVGGDVGPAARRHRIDERRPSPRA